MNQLFSLRISSIIVVHIPAETFSANSNAKLIWLLWNTNIEYFKKKLESSTEFMSTTCEIFEFDSLENDGMHGRWTA